MSKGRISVIAGLSCLLAIPVTAAQAPYGLGIIAPSFVAAAQYRPTSDARDREAALGLTRAERRDIQRDLSILGYQAGQPDGDFGYSTRSALADWQRDNNHQPTGYLTRNMRQQILRQAARVRGDTEPRVTEAETAMWSRVKRQDTQAAYHQYLQAYPRGAYVDEARQNIKRLSNTPPREVQPDHLTAYAEARSLDTIAAYEDFLRAYPNSWRAPAARERLAELRRFGGDRIDPEDMKAWRKAQTAHSVQGYERYLARFPNGHYAKDARRILKDLRKSELPSLGELQREEDKWLNNNPGRIAQVQHGLRQLGWDPGPEKGVMTEQTRQAIRNYQRKAGRKVTGYVDAWLWQNARPMR